jgi:hypothetical protein
MHVEPRQDDGTVPDLEGEPPVCGIRAARQDPVAQLALEQSQDLLLPFSSLIRCTDLLPLERAKRQQAQGDGRQQDDHAEQENLPRAAVENPPQVVHRYGFLAQLHARIVNPP